MFFDGIGMGTWGYLNPARCKHQAIRRSQRMDENVTAEDGFREIPPKNT
jgi:hypothetical protein